MVKGKKIHWLRWDIICRAKWNDGMGFQDFEAFNQAMLAKQAWRIVQDANLMVSHVLKSKYF